MCRKGGHSNGKLTVLGTRVGSGGPGGAGVKCLVRQDCAVIDDRVDLLQWEQARYQLQNRVSAGWVFVLGLPKFDRFREHT